MRNAFVSGTALLLGACGPNTAPGQDAPSTSAAPGSTGPASTTGEGSESTETELPPLVTTGGGTTGDASSSETGSSSTGLTVRTVVGLGDLDGGEVYSAAAAISADGTTVVGASCIGHSVSAYVYYCHTGAFVWTRGDAQMQSLDSLPGWYGSGAFDVSADGSVIVGAAADEAPLFWPPFFNDLVVHPSRGARWTADGVESLGVSFVDGPSNVALAVSDDASTVAGFDQADVGVLFTDSILLRDGELDVLGGLPGSYPAWALESFARDVSADGRVVVGTSSGEVDGVAASQHAYMWHDGTFTGLGLLEGWEETGATAVSADGSIVVGYARRTNPLEFTAFRWEAGAFVDLGDLPGGDVRGSARGISPDGSVVVGAGYTDEGSRATIWDEEHGLRDLNEVLREAPDVDLGEWELSAAADVAADNRTLVGYGVNPDGHTEAWLVELP